MMEQTSLTDKTLGQHCAAPADSRPIPATRGDKKRDQNPCAHSVPDRRTLRMWIKLLALCCAVLGPGGGGDGVTAQVASDEKSVTQVRCFYSSDSERSVYNYSIKDVHSSRMIDWSRYRGRVVLLVNVASFWGSTDQYPPMNALHNFDDDFAILGVPCNQFALVSERIIHVSCYIV